MAEVKLVDPERFRAAAKEHGADDLGLFKSSVAEIKATDEERTLEFVISDGLVDRDFDTINVRGWDLKFFRKAPTVLFSHQSSMPPIAKASRTRVEGDQLVSAAEFTPKDVNPFGDMIFQMVKGGFLKATSVGFRPLKFEFVTEQEDEERFQRGGLNFHRQELLEFSIVGIGANPRAMRRSNDELLWLAKSHEAGIDTTPLREWAEQVLDLSEPLKGLTRDEVENAWEIVREREVIIDLGGAKSPEKTEGNPPVEVDPDPEADAADPAKADATLVTTSPEEIRVIVREEIRSALNDQEPEDDDDEIEDLEDDSAEHKADEDDPDDPEIGDFEEAQDYVLNLFRERLASVREAGR